MQGREVIHHTRMTVIRPINVCVIRHTPGQILASYVIQLARSLRHTACMTYHGHTLRYTLRHTPQKFQFASEVNQKSDYGRPRLLLRGGILLPRLEGRFS